MTDRQPKTWTFFGRWMGSCYHFIVTDSGSVPPKSKSLSLAARGPGVASGKKRPSRGAAHPSATDFLLRALGAKEAMAKREWAEKGLEAYTSQNEDDAELKALLLRQLYQCALDAEAHDEAYDLALCMIDLEELGDIARQDAARAALGLGRMDEAIEHVRIASKVCPQSRRSFHLGHLGALLRFSGQLDKSVQAFEEATRCAGPDTALYQAQQALAEAERGTDVPQLRRLREQLENGTPQKGYAQWILGELCYRLGDYSAAARYLKRFLERIEDAPRAKCLSLKGEIAHARMLLKKTTA